MFGITKTMVSQNVTPYQEGEMAIAPENIQKAIDGHNQ